MDITPAIPKGLNVIKGYGDMVFKINDYQYDGSIIVLPERVINWSVNTHSEISLDSLSDVLSIDDIEVLLIGCGDVHMPLDINIIQKFQNVGIGVEIMTTGAACRTYNVLLAEGRKVVAALIRV